MGHERKMSRGDAGGQAQSALLIASLAGAIWCGNSCLCMSHQVMKLLIT